MIGNHDSSHDDGLVQTVLQTFYEIVRFIVAGIVESFANILKPKHRFVFQTNESENANRPKSFRMENRGEFHTHLVAGKILISAAVRNPSVP